MARKKRKPLPADLIERMNHTDAERAESGDGAWWAYLEDTVRHYNDEQGTNYDPCDTVQRWIQQR